MNSVELAIYNLVKNNPKTKSKLVAAYQSILSIIPQEKFKSDYQPTVREGYFYGFHDKSPFNKKGDKLLSHKQTIKNRIVRAGDTSEIGFFAGENWCDFTSLGSTNAWNWQLGSMLHWHDPERDTIAYNVFTNSGDHVSRIIDRDGSILHEFNRPIVHSHGAAKLASSYDFDRVEKAMPGYGAVRTSPQPSNQDDSFRIFSTATGRTTYEISLEEAASIAPHPSMAGAFHFFHHSLFNPSGNRCFFLHRWVDRNDRRWTRMFSVAGDGSDLHLFPMDEMVSHITWASDQKLIAYARMPAEGDGYYIITDKTNQYQKVLSDHLNSDGHPTMCQDREIIITDTYPDRFRNQNLFLYNTKTNKLENLCRTHLPKHLKKELQVDLHPRLHPTHPVACFDSGHTGTRSLVTLNFSRATE